MLQNFYGVIQVKHYQNGRLRLQTDILKENEELEQEKAKLQYPKAIEGVAREELGLVKPGEVPYVK